MGTTSEKLQAILDSKADIKDAIEQKGVTVGSTPLSGYAQKILDIPTGGDTDGMTGFLSVESKTIATSASTTTNIAYNKKIGIIDENNVLWDTLDWHQRWVDNGYSATGLSKPIGIWMDGVFGKDIKLLWPITTVNGYYDITGTTDGGNTKFSHFMYDNDAINIVRGGNAYPAIGNIAHGTAGKYNASAWNTALNGDGLDMYSANTKETFTIPSRDVGNTSMFMKDNNEDYMESYYQQCEFYRACFAICSGISTSQANGTVTTVEILNSAGQQAAVGEDMYFWIGGSNTGLYAKYNLNSRLVTNPTTGEGNDYYLTQARADVIYASQKANGVNMNDTGVNSSSKRTLCEGSKGAEAVAVDGYWYIKTPYISRPDNTNKTLAYNLPDARATYICKYRNVSLPTEWMLLAYYFNKNTLITAIVNMLRTTEGLSANVPETAQSFYWSALRLGTSNATYIHTGNGYANQNYTNIYYYLIPCPLSSTQFIKHTT